MLLMPAKSVSTCRAHRAHRVAPRRVARAVHASSSQHAKATGATQQLALPRRELLTSLGAVATLVLAPGTATAADIETLTDEPGSGAIIVRANSLVLCHYVGSLESGEVFDSTRGGLNYMNGGAGVFQPVIVRVSGDPVPGITAGLVAGLKGMVAGGKRTVKVTPAAGFGGTTVVAPYAVVPGDSTLTYEVEVLRVSNSGPDELMKFISFCGQGGAGAQIDGCADIVPL